PEPRFGDAEVLHDLGQSRIAREAVEHGIEIVHRMADLVDRERLVLLQPAFIVERLFLEKATDLVARIEEVVVAGAGLVAGAEDADVARIEGVDDLARALAERRHLFGRFEAVEDKIAVTRESRLLFVSEHGPGPEPEVAACAGW